MRTSMGHIVFFGVLLLFRVDLLAQDDQEDAQVRKNLETIENVFRQGETDARWWWYGWLAGYSAATVAQGAVGVTSHDTRTRQDMALGAATTLLGALGQLFSPMRAVSAADQLEKLPEDTPEERKEKVLTAEKWLEECARQEKFGRSWKMHAITGAVNIGSGLITWLGFKRTVWDGLANFALNTVVTEVQIWTQPVRAARAYRDYQEMKPTDKITWSVRVCPGGIGLQIAF